MAGNFVNSEQIALYQGFVKGIREDLGRFVTLHIPGPPVMCPNCLFDPINHKSAGTYSPRTPYPSGTIPGPTYFAGGQCPICNGTGQFTVEITKSVLAGIRWLKTEQSRYLIQGLEANNDFRLKCDIQYFEDFKKARRVDIDGIPTEVQAITKAGLSKLIQIKVFCKRSEFNPGMKTDVTKF